jgi:hypothetical protein
MGTAKPILPDALTQSCSSKDESKFSPWLGAELQQTHTLHLQCIGGVKANLDTRKADERCEMWWAIAKIELLTPPLGAAMANFHREKANE